MKTFDNILTCVQLADADAYDRGMNDDVDIRRHLGHALKLIVKAQDEQKELIAAVEAAIESLGGYNDEMDNLGTALRKVKDGR